jgi:hypothetical protein
VAGIALFLDPASAVGAGWLFEDTVLTTFFSLWSFGFSAFALDGTADGFLEADLARLAPVRVIVQRSPKGKKELENSSFSLVFQHFLLDPSYTHG